MAKTSVLSMSVLVVGDGVNETFNVVLRDCAVRSLSQPDPASRVDGTIIRNHSSVG